MNLVDFIERKEEFLTYLEVEKNLAQNTYRAYQSDMNQFITFWQELGPEEQKHLGMRQVIERFLVKKHTID